MSVAASGLLTMSEIRARAAAALAPVADSDPYVFANVVDALEPPALVLGWDDPWLEFKTSCMFDASFAVICVAGRVEPDPGVEMLEQLVTYTITRLKADTYPWPLASSQAPRRFDFANITYLGARVVYRVPVTVA